MATRLAIVPDPRFEALAPALAERLSAVMASITPDNFASLTDALFLEVLKRGVEEVGADEATIWLPDAGGENLVPGCNTGSRAAEFVGVFRQPLSSGLVSLVFATEQSMLVNAAHADPRHSPLADHALGQRTDALIAVPFSFLRSGRGVLSCVRLGAGAGGQFAPEHLGRIQRTSAVLGRLVEHRVLGETVGWSPHT
jgi:hypothetical protein